MTIKLVQNNEQKSKTDKSEANRLVGDSIMNFKTIQSFGHEDFVIKYYEKLTEAVTSTQKETDVKLGLSFAAS